MNGEGGGTGSIRGGGHCFPGQGEDLLRKGEALEVVATEAAGGAAPVPGVVSREQQRHPEALVQRLDAADQVHRRADHGEVEAVGGADVAVHGVSDMQRDAEAEGGLAGGLAPGRADRKRTRLNSSHYFATRLPTSPCKTKKHDETKIQTPHN